MLIALLVRDACCVTAVGLAERLLAQGHPDDAQLRELQDHLASEFRAGDALFLNSLRFERAAWFQTGQVILTGEGLESREWLELRSNTIWFWFNTSNNVRFGQALNLQLMNEAVEIAKLPLQKQHPKWTAFDAKLRGIEKTPRTGLAVLLMPAVLKVFNAHAKSQSLLGAAVVAVAAERYRLAHGNWPAKLENLVPEFLSEIPIDPFADAAILYRRVEDGVVVYSVGAEGQDNDGKLYRRKPGDVGAPALGTDIGFRLWNPDKRRQPPANKKAEENDP